MKMITWQAARDSKWIRSLCRWTFWLEPDNSSTEPRSPRSHASGRMPVLLTGSCGKRIWGRGSGSRRMEASGILCRWRSERREGAPERSRNRRWCPGRFGSGGRWILRVLGPVTGCCRFDALPWPESSNLLVEHSGTLTKKVEAWRAA